MPQLLHCLPPARPPVVGALVLTLALFLSASAGCRPSPSASSGRVPLIVSAASDLTVALREIAARYEADTGQPVTLNFGSTGQIAQQIEHGAPVDLFFAADEQRIDALIAQGLMLPETRRVYGIGRLALVASKHAGRRPQTLRDLASPETRHVAIAHPEHAPYGRAAKQALERSGLWAEVQPKLVFGDNILQTFQYVETGNADAGLIALALVVQRHEVPFMLVDEALHDPLRQVAAVVAGSKQPATARSFLNYVLGPVGRPILERYGFRTPQDGGAEHPSARSRKAQAIPRTAASRSRGRARMTSPPARQGARELPPLGGQGVGGLSSPPHLPAGRRGWGHC